jgi:signal transduction histidine kinase
MRVRLYVPLDDIVAPYILRFTERQGKKQCASRGAGIVLEIHMIAPPRDRDPQLRTTANNTSERRNQTPVKSFSSRIVTSFYLITFLGVVATAALLALFYRQVAIDGLVQIRKQDSIGKSYSELSSMLEPLSSYLNGVKEIKPGDRRSRPLSDVLRLEIQELLLDPTVVRVKIYNAIGVIVFSTLPDQIGSDQSSNHGFVFALQGTATAELIFRDLLNAFERVTEDDNLMHTYVPVRLNAASPVLGVLEVYTDMNSLVRAIEQTTFKLMAGGLVLLLLLYTGFVLMVHYGRRIIEAQQQTIRERTSTLELLTAQILTRHESERRELADNLHEGVAQTLAAIKLSVESTLRSASDSSQPPKHLHEAVHAIQAAIQEVRGIAMELHPSILDDFGLYSALEWICGEFEILRPGARAERHLQMDEDDVPPPLVTILYRIAADTFKVFGMNEQIRSVGLRLRKRAETITLTIDETLDNRVLANDQNHENADSILAKIRQTTVLSGGVLTMTGNASGGRILRAEWMT